MPIRTENLEYLRPAGAAPLLARFYRPEGVGPFPAVLEVHGGAWTAGDRLNNVAIGEYLAAHGIAVLSIDFRIRFLKANAERFSTRAELVGGLGTSSGGHLLLLNALLPRDLRYASIPMPGADAGVAFAVVCWPVADPLARYHAVRERGNERLVEAHHQFWPSEDAMAEGNPQLIVERGGLIEKPPALIMQGTADDNLTPDMAANFAAAYTRAGGSISFHRFEGQPHAFIARDPAAPDALRALSLIADFIHHQIG